jgi:cytochrome c553
VQTLLSGGAPPPLSAGASFVSWESLPNPNRPQPAAIRRQQYSRSTIEIVSRRACHLEQDMHHRSGMWRALVWLTVLVSTLPARADEPRVDGTFRHHMRQELSDLRTIERMLVHGQLDDAKLFAYLLARNTSAQQLGEARTIALAAGALTQARSVEDAVHAESRIVAACTRCHAAARARPAFRMPSGSPPDRPTAAAQMARYVWAIDRLWEGMLGASDEHWRAGLYVIATAPLPKTLAPSPKTALRLQQLARNQLARTPTIEQRSALYSEIVIACAGCHARH